MMKPQFMVMIKTKFARIERVFDSRMLAIAYINDMLNKRSDVDAYMIQPIKERV